MKNPALAQLDDLVGEWTLTMTGAWFLDRLDTEVPGRATFEWLGESFVAMHSELGGDPAWERGVARVFAMTFSPTEWTLTREDPDFSQRFVARREGDRIVGQWDASEDGGRSWRKDFDVIFERRSGGSRAG
jgi:hypothetical protein